MKAKEELEHKSHESRIIRALNSTQDARASVRSMISNVCTLGSMQVQAIHSISRTLPFYHEEIRESYVPGYCRRYEILHLRQKDLVRHCLSSL